MRRTKSVLWICLLLSFVSLIYLRHFHNGFHFDDIHAVVLNPYIRDLHNIPKFFTDARTFSILPTNRTYRPIVSTSLALDYAVGGGLNPLYFQASTFVWYLVQLVLMYFLFRTVADLARPDPRNLWMALFATSWYGLHPAMAETVNYVIQRGDLYSTLGVIAAVLIYARYPRQRKYGLYLLPFVGAVLSKAPALIFPAILLVYLWLFEEDAQPGRLIRALLHCAPAFLVTAALVWFSAAMTPKEFNPGTPSVYAYRITQPLVALRYFLTFFAPGGLTADTDHKPVPSIWIDWAWLGFLFVFAVITVAVVSSRRREWRPVSFGLWWFLLAILPTSIFPLAEVENDHRMFFPFVGLVLSASWPVALWIYHQPRTRRVFAIGLSAVCVVELMVLALGTVQRNLVWHTEESLWRDVTVKSPRNARGWLNYGVSQLQKRSWDPALASFERAKALEVNYPLADNDLGIVKGKLKRKTEAEQHFHRALRLLPRDSAINYSYAAWLKDNGRSDEAGERLRLVMKMNPDYLPAAYLEAEIHAVAKDWTALRTLAENILARFPSEQDAKAYRLMAACESGELATAGGAITSFQTASTFLQLSALYYQTGKFDQSRAAAESALKLRPNYSEAYNNIAAAERARGNWDAAAQAAREALRLRPTYETARVNLTRSMAHERDPSDQ